MTKKQLLFLKEPMIRILSVYVLLCALGLLPLPLFAETNHATVACSDVAARPFVQQEISGIVTDTKGMPLAGVTVVVKGTTQGVSTNFEGQYTLRKNNKSGVLVFSYVGYKTQKIPINNQSRLNVTMVETVSQLDDVVLVAYGVQKKINVTGAVTSIKTDDVITTPATNVKSLIVGRVPGVITNQNPGLPGSDDVSLSIRGFGTPLVIVDGVEGSFGRLDPNDIENISILKDASAAIYGVRGGDGVILVTTKRGKAGKVSINYHGYTGIQHQTTNYAQANAAEYIQAKRSGLFNAQYTPDDPTAPIDYGDYTEAYLEEYQSGKLKSYDWVDALIKKSGAQITSHNIGASGGTEKIRFYTSLGATTQNSIIKGDYNYKKLNVTNNLDANLSKDLSLLFNSSYIRDVRDYSITSIGTISNDLRTAQPFYPTELPDPTRAPYSGFTARSPVARARKDFSGYNYRTRETLAAALELAYKVPALTGLTLGAKANVRSVRNYGENLTKRYGVYRYDKETDEYALVQTLNEFPSFSKNLQRSLRVLSRLYLNYKQDFGKHNLGVLVFGERQENTSNGLGATRRELLTDLVPTITSGDDSQTTTRGNARPVEYSRISFAGRFNYAYDEKYLLEATFRADASSKVSPQVRWGYFPAISLGWNIAKENFMKASLFKQLKLRLSYSKTGNDKNISDTSFDYLTGYEQKASVYYLDGNPVPNIVTTGLVNDRLTWTKNTLYNAGLDFQILKGKVYGNFDVFYRVTEGIIAKPIESVPSTFGANLPSVNINSKNDHGFDLSVGYKTAIGGVKINLLGNFSYARERYQDWQQDIDLTDPNQVRINRRNGRYVNRTFGYVTDGLINSQDELAEYLKVDYVADKEEKEFKTLNGTPQVGNIRYVDISGPEGMPDGVIDLYDLREIGYGSAPDMTFGLNMRFAYKNLSLSMLWQGASLFNVSVGDQFRGPFSNEASPLKLTVKYNWTQDPNHPGVGNNPDARLPAYDDDGIRDWNQNSSDFWLKDATYVRLKTASINYSLPKKTLDKIGFQKCDFYLSGDNLLTFDSLGIFSSYIDPEQASRSTRFSLPLLTTYTFGVRIGL